MEVCKGEMYAPPEKTWGGKFIFVVFEEDDIVFTIKWRCSLYSEVFSDS